jgi:signal transduction histidine kinase
LVLLVPVIVLAPTYANLGGFNLTSCDAFMFEGFLFQFYRVAFGILAMLWILVLLIRKYRSSPADFRKQIVLMGVGIEFFLFLFFIITFLAAYLTDTGILSDSRLEFYGLFGMPIFMIFIAILIVRFKMFNAKLFATQALVFGTALLIGAQLFTATGLTGFAVTLATFILFLIAGFFLIQSVRREIEQRELIQKQEKELEVVNAQQENLLHFVSHEVKGYLGKSAAAFASIVEGDFGPVPDMLKTMSVGVLADVRKGVATVMDILDSANLKKGTFAYNKAPFDFKKAAEETVQDLKKDAEEKKLALTLSVGDGVFTMNGDEDKIRRHVIRNLVDNSIKYTPSGSIQVTVTREGNIVRFVVQDTGVGITPEDMQHLFTEGGHGKDSVKVNVHSTGFGLFIAKQVVVAHGGTIKAESEGAGKGSRFTVELPAA